MPLIDNNPEKSLTVEHFVAGFWIMLVGLSFYLAAFSFERCCYPKKRHEKTQEESNERVPGWVVPPDVGKITENVI